MVKGWTEVDLISLSDGGMQNGVFYEVARKGSGIPLINVSDMYRQSPIMRENLDLFDATEDEIERFAVNDGDLFFTRSSVVPRGIAFCNWFSSSIDTPVVFDSHVIRFKTNKRRVVPMFLYLQCITPKARKYFIVNSKTATMTTIDQSVIGKCPIDLPPYEEQQKIADSMSDINRLICNLEKLIAKKKAIKQGAMQELLTGKKRLPGFSGDWESFLFGDLFDFIPNNAFTRAQLAVSGKAKNIHYGDILTKYGAYINADSTDIPYIAKEIDLSRFSEKCYLRSGDVIIADTAEDETVGKTLEVIRVDHPILAGQHTLLCRPRIQFAEKFLGYYLNAACYHDQLLPCIVGTKVSSVSKASVAQTKLVVPEFEEQQTIASILSDMDDDIIELEQKLAKYRQVKQGMMQQLLTGKIRLV